MPFLVNPMKLRFDYHSLTRHLTEWRDQCAHDPRRVLPVWLLRFVPAFSFVRVCYGRDRGVRVWLYWGRHHAVYFEAFLRCK